MFKYIAASLVFSGGCSAQMIEYDLTNFPEYEPDPTGSSPVKWKVQCPADARCFLNTNTTSVLGPDPDDNFRLGEWEDFDWYYFLEGSTEILTPERLFQGDNFDPFIRGDYCDEGSTCSLICTDSCLCGLEWVPAVECAILDEYPDTVLPEREERTIYEYSSATSGVTMQLRCDDFLNGCYLDQDSYEQFQRDYGDTTYDGFFAADYNSCVGKDEGPCRVGCDPGCTCTMVDQVDGSTSECTMAPPTAAPTDAPTNPPTESPTPGSGTSSLGLKLVGSIVGIIALNLVL